MKRRMDKFILFFSVLVLLSQCASSPKKLEKQRENDPKYQYNLGLFYLNNNEVDQAIQHLTRAISLETKHYLAYNALGLAYAMKGRLQDALHAYNKCLEINPSFTEARNNLGSLYQEMGYLDKAEEEFRKALADINYQARELPAYNLARLYYLREDYETAMGFIQNALRFNSRLAMAYNLRGLIQNKLNRLAEAIESFSQAVKLVPEDINFNFNLAVAIESFSQAVKLVPEDINFNFNLAVAYFHDGQNAKAKEIFEKILPLVRDQELREQIASYLKQIHDR